MSKFEEVTDLNEIAALEKEGILWTCVSKQKPTLARKQTSPRAMLELHLHCNWKFFVNLEE